jgi:hypothetical protein
MSPTKELVEAVAAVLQGIAAGPVYNTNAGAWVTTEPEQVQDEAPGVVAVVFERKSRATDPAVKRTHQLVTVAIVLKLPHEQDEAQVTLDDAIEDIERAMDNNLAAYPKRISHPTWLETLPIPADKGMGWIGAVLRYESHVPKVRSNP